MPLCPCCWKANGDFIRPPTSFDEEAGVLVEAGQILAVVFLERGLVIPGVHLALAAVHEQPDHRFRLRRKMRRFRRERIDRASPARPHGRWIPSRPESASKRASASRPAPEPGAAEEVAARTKAAMRMGEEMWEIHASSRRSAGLKLLCHRAISNTSSSRVLDIHKFIEAKERSGKSPVSASSSLVRLSGIARRPSPVP